MNMTMKDLRIHTLRGDIQSCGMSGYNKKGITSILFDRYVNGTEIPITKAEFNSVLNEEYKKIEDWRSRQENN